MFENLNLRLGRPLPQEEIAKNPMSLSAFGNLGRYLFLTALELFVAAEGGDTKPVAKYVAMSWQTLDKGALKQMKCPLGSLQRQLDSDSINRVYSLKLRQWFRDSVKENRKFNTEEKNLFTKSMGFLSKGSDIAESGLKTLEKVAWSISSQMGQLFNESVFEASSIQPKEVKALFTELRETTRALTGKSTLRVDDPNIALRAKKNKSIATLLADYKDILKDIRDLFNLVLKKEVAHGPMEAGALEKKMRAMGFEMLFFPSTKNGFEGLVGLVDGKLALYTTNGQMLHGGIHPEAKITMNKNFDTETQDGYYLQYVAPNAATATRVYTVGFRNKADAEKHQNTNMNLGNTEKWIATWRRDLKSKDPMRQVPAVIAYILYMTGARVGSSTESRSKTGKGQTYGISSLLAGQVKISGNKIDIKYIGKKQVAQHHVLNIPDDPYFKICAQVIAKLKEGKKPADPLFTFPKPGNKTGALQQVTYALFLKYMKTCGVTHVHGMRHVRGTKLAQELLTSVTFKPKGNTIKQRQADADKYIKDKILTKVGELLGHKSTSKTGEEKILWSTCIKSYVNPQVVVDWYHDQKLDVPRWIPKTIEE